MGLSERDYMKRDVDGSGCTPVLENPQKRPKNCPKCQSLNVHVDKKGYHIGFWGGVLCGIVGPIGALVGTTHSNDIVQTCLDCGYSWEAKYKEAKKQESNTLIVLLLLLLLVVGLLLSTYLPVKTKDVKNAHPRSRESIERQKLDEKGFRELY